MIESAQNKIIKFVRSLQGKKVREQEGVFLAEGLRFVCEIPSHWPVAFFLVSEKLQQEKDISALVKNRAVYTVTEALFQTLCETKNAQGILAVCKQQPQSWNLDLEKGNGLYVICEELNDPGNLGTIIRTAHAAGADGIFLSKGSVDAYNSKVLRATMGSIFHVPVYTDVEIENIAAKLHKAGIALYAAHLKGVETPYGQDFTKGCAFLIGNEARGLQEKTAKLADTYLKLPMPGGAESLNASVAASLLLYEAVRQRL